MDPLPALPKPKQGEIWFAKLPTDPADKLPRPVVIVSLDGRNQNQRALTVLAVPISTTLTEPLHKLHLRLKPGETGLREESEVQGEGITTLSKADLKPAREKLTQLSRSKVRHIAKLVVLAMGILPAEVGE